MVKVRGCGRLLLVLVENGHAMFNVRMCIINVALVLNSLYWMIWQITRNVECECVWTRDGWVRTFESTVLCDTDMQPNGRKVATGKY